MTTQTPDSKPRALIAMSGGVDSSVAAWLMQQAGYDCTGITMRLTRNETLGQSGFHTCCSEKDIEDAAEVAFAMDIPYEVLDFTADFREQIIEKFVRVYEAGGTPNPCIDCNKYMKFRHLLDWARAHGMEYVVTGHYARVEQDEATGRFLLKKGLDEGKDQSYVLYNLTQEQLAHIRLPLGGLHKTEVREIAEQHKFVNAHKHDSQDICFVPDGDYARFMEDFTGKHYPAGDFLDESGRVVGTDNGAVRYTIGQRKGLGLAMGAPVYVCGKDMQANTVTVGPEEMLFDRIVYADEVNWIAIPELTGPLRVTASTRYHQVEQAATVYPAECGFGWDLTSRSAPYARSGRGAVSGRHRAGRRHHYESGKVTRRTKCKISIPARSCCWARKLWKNCTIPAWRCSASAAWAATRWKRWRAAAWGHWI